MKAVFSMWKNTRMIILTAVCAAIYGAALIAFKTAIPLIPGITEVRVGNILPVPFGLLFGPAGAWGAAFGNLIGDLLGGTLGPGSAGGFIGQLSPGLSSVYPLDPVDPFPPEDPGMETRGHRALGNLFSGGLYLRRGLRRGHRDRGGTPGDRSLSGIDQDYHHQQYRGRLASGLFC